MRKPLLVLLVAIVAMPLVTPLTVSEANACRNAVMLPVMSRKPTCEARNQRAQWQAEQTARMTAQLVANAMAQQAAADKQEGGLIVTIKGMIETVVETVSGLF